MLRWFLGIGSLVTAKFYYPNFHVHSHLVLSHEVVQQGGCLALPSSDAFFTFDSAIANVGWDFSTMFHFAFSGGASSAFLQTLSFMLQESGVVVDNNNPVFKLTFETQGNAPSRLNIHSKFGEKSVSDTRVIPNLGSQRHSTQLHYRHKHGVLHVNIDNKPVLKIHLCKHKRCEIGPNLFAFFGGNSSGELIGHNQSVMVCDWHFGARHSGCFPGFHGAHCLLNPLPAMSQCLALSDDGCEACMSHFQNDNCVWCMSKSRCVPAPSMGGHFCPGGVLENVQCLPAPWWGSQTLLVILLSGLVLTLLYKLYASSASQTLFVTDCCSLAMCSFGGSLFALLVAFVINTTLVEITLSSFYASVCGSVLVCFGVALLYQSVAAHVGRTVHLEGKTEQFAILVFLACFTVCSGVICFVLPQATLRGSHLKIPMYGMLGFALSFCVVLACLQLLQHCMKGDSLLSIGRSALTQSSLQARLLLGSASLCGLYFGVVFGCLDVEDVDQHLIALALQRDDRYCYPFAAVIGAATGAVSQYVHLYGIDPIRMGPIDDGI